MNQHGEPIESMADETVKSLVPSRRVFQRYVLNKVIGRGGMGIVWLAQDEKLNREVALKFLPDIVRLDASAFDDLKREARKNLELTHPHIVRIYDFVDDEEGAAISMEYVDGTTLSKLRVERLNKFFEPEELTVWVSQLCAALDYAHTEAKLVHRDLKPSNLMVNSRGRLKVADFGIARSISDSVSRISVDRTTAGTLAYMSPQQLRGEHPSPCDDIYSLGATLYELVTSRPPFYSGDLSKQVENKRPPRMSVRRREMDMDGDEIPEVWEETIAACLSKDPWKRPQSAVEVVQRLGLPAISTGHVVVAGASVGSRWRRARSMEMMVGVAALVLMVGGMFLYFNNATDITQSAQNSNPAPPTPKVKPSTPPKTPPPNAEARAWPPLEAFDDSATPRVLPKPLSGASNGQPWENSLGMKFVPVGKVGFSVCETRVRDFAAFVTDSGHDASEKVSSFSAEGWKEEGFFWQNPGFKQTEDHPVCCVSWDDAMAFCRWLTERERKDGRLTKYQRYRLPFGSEWVQATGGGSYPWGEGWPPATGTVNLAGDEARAESWPRDRETINSFSDPFPRTAPVGSFQPNRAGIYDLAGNVWEWCMDWSDSSRARHVFRGGAWDTTAEKFLSADFQHPMETFRRNTTIGFRCVLEEVAAP